MTNAWGDVASTKMFMVLGSNFVENHPGVTQHANEAMEKNKAKFVCVDPRRTRTVAWGEQRALAQGTGNSAFARIRPGSNGAFMCGLTNYAITNTKYGETDIGGVDGETGTSAAGTSATTLTRSTSDLTTDQYKGWYVRLTSEGYEPSWRKISGNTESTITFTPAANKPVTNCNYEVWRAPLVDHVYLYNNTDAPFKLNGGVTDSTQVDYERAGGAGTGIAVFADTSPASGAPNLYLYDDKYSPYKCKDGLERTGSVYEALKSRVSHYTPDVVAEVCGINADEFNALAAIVTAPENRPGTIMYAMGGTQHTSAAQDLRAYCILQLVLGNMGKSGGGVNALRGIHNVQGSTDQGLLYSSMPAYSDVPDTDFGNTTYYDYMNSLFGNDAGNGLQQKGFRNMMHCWFDQTASGAATGQAGKTDGVHSGSYNSSGINYNFRLLPQGVGYNHVKMFQKMQAAKESDPNRVRFLMCLGQNPAVTEPNMSEIRQGLKELDTLVVADLFMSETATCDRDGRTILLPSCAHPEEGGSVTSSARMIYWRYMATPPKGNSKNDLWILLKLAKALDATVAFDHIDTTSEFTTAHPGKSAYEVLYGLQYHFWDPTNVPDFSAKCNTGVWNNSSATGRCHPNGLERYMGEAVAEEVFKQMAASTSDGTENPRAKAFGVDYAYRNNFGSSWIYAMAYNPSSVKYGTRLAADAAVGAESITVSHNDMADQGVTAGSTKLIIGNFGAPGTGAATADGGNEETVEVSGTWTGGTTYTITLASTLGKAHKAGELVTHQGAWSADARDGIVAKSRATYDPGRNKLYGRFGWAWLYNRHVFYNNNPCGGNPNTSTPKEFYFAEQTQPGSQPNTTNGRGGDRFAPGYLTYCETTCKNGPTVYGGNGTCKAPGDTFDYWVAPDARARLFVHHKSVAVTKHPQAPSTREDEAAVRGGFYPGSSGGRYPGSTPIVTTLNTYDKLYRKYSTLADWDHHLTSSTTYPQRPARMPKQWEPHETPNADAESKYGHTGDNPVNAIGTVDDYPYVLTTFRISWHFQGGVMTRNVPWLAELDPDPYIEINSADAYEKGIKTGDTVRITTARQTGGSSTGNWKARVGTGTQANQNTKLGVVGVPWHWGKALGATSSGALTEGACANEHCIDAVDTNVKMPESKACLCNFIKL